MASPSCNSIVPGRGAAAGLAGVTLGHFLIDLCMGWLPPTLPFLAVRLDFSLALAGTAVAVVTTLSSFSQPVLGWLGERVRGNGLLVACVLWTAACTGLLGLTRSFGALVGVALLAALGSALYHPLGSVRAVRLFPEHKGKAVSIYSASGSLGYAVAPVVAVPLVLTVGLEGSLLLLIPGVAVALVQLAGGRAPVAGPVARAAERLEPGPRYRSLVWLQVITALRSWVMMAFATFLVWYLLAAGVEPALAAVLVSAYLMAGVGGGLVGGTLTDRFGTLAVLGWSGLISLGLLAVFLTAGGWVQLTALLLAGALLHTAFPGSVVLAQELLPGQAGMAAGMVMGLSFGLAGLGVAVTGWLADGWGLTAALGWTSLALVPATLFVLPLRASAPRPETAGSGGSGPNRVGWEG